jgi:tRNA(Ile)-lysidine synthase
VPSDAIDTLSTPVIRAIADHLLPYPPQRLGVAVSGGSDSMALLHALHALSLDHGFDLHAVTVDHGLRAEAPAEAAMVADACAALGVSHDILRWSGPDATGNLQHQARNARYDLMAEWSDMRQLCVIALGHTQDDQAETVLLRLARGAGVDGLSAMRPRRTDRGVTWLRPLLNVRRERLRAFLTELDVAWADDPTNQDLKYDRIKARQALAALEPLGIHVSQLAQVASNMASARDALCWQTFLNSREITQVEVGAVVFDWKGFRLLPAACLCRPWSGSGKPNTRRAGRPCLPCWPRCVRIKGERSMAALHVDLARFCGCFVNTMPWQRKHPFPEHPGTDAGS